MIKLHGVALSPFVRKVMLCLELKGLAYENLPVFPGAEDPEFRALSPLGKVPVLEYNDFTTPDSSIICRYLDRLHPEPSLYPSDPIAEARTLWLEEFADSKLIEACAGLFQQRFLFPKMFNQTTDDAVVEEILTAKLPPLLDYLESVTPETGYLVADTITIADIAVGTCFLQARYGDFSPDPSRYPKLSHFLTTLLNSALITERMAAEAQVVANLGTP